MRKNMLNQHVFASALIYKLRWIHKNADLIGWEWFKILQIITKTLNKGLSPIYSSKVQNETTKIMKRPKENISQQQKKRQAC